MKWPLTVKPQLTAQAIQDKTRGDKTTLFYQGSPVSCKAGILRGYLKPLRTCSQRTMKAKVHFVFIIGLIGAFSSAVTVDSVQTVPKGAKLAEKRFWFFKPHLQCDSSRPPDRKWANDWDQPMHFSCPTGQAMSSLYSIWRSCKRDRIWSFSCRSTSGTQSCSGWESEWNNEWDRAVYHMCDNNGYITGIQSVHDNGKEDRRFRFSCCRSTGYKTIDCETDTLNNFQQLLYYKLPENKVIAGLFSYHKNEKEDRVWKAYICSLKRDQCY
ncbi:dermatopontin-like [Montipora foliosa]|uniref:dermatopontin-like n=1 Tax=Montipora foliosa TaxID=591990 RepID=UPI0035F12FF0